MTAAHAYRPVQNPASLPAGVTVLVVEDDFTLREALVDTLELAGATVLQTDSGEAALALLAEQYVDLVVSDVNMGGMDGMALLQALRQQQPQLPVILATAYGSIGKSVEAMRAGAADYLVKPFKPQQLVETVARYVGAAGVDADQPVAEEPASLQLLALARRVAATDSTVLICGESGTGKEVLARYIHRQSPRNQGAFVALNCAAIPENMLEAMLFGHEKGAFTGAHASAPGKFEQANGGTILLDEISEMALPLQAKLLRVIQEREVERLGGRRVIPLDVRILATTNRDLRGEVAAGRFREDLYYRLSVFPLQWQPLRARPADIVPIALRLLASHARRMGRSGVRFGADAERALRAHPWPGNVRELDNVVQRALILQPGGTIAMGDLCLDPYATVPGTTASLATAIPDSGWRMTAGSGMDRREVEGSGLGSAAAPLAGTAYGAAAAPDGFPVDALAAAASPHASPLGEDLQQREFAIILQTLRACGGSRKQTAERLSISPRTLRYKLARMREEGMALPGGDGM